ncbi:MAG TPA: glutamate cyclase domain-containing protein [Pseudohaliea sp.]|nr:glutamate cyclase domain-containing protein [Pseudohaliea sp.]
MTPEAFDNALEALLVARNPRGMQTLRGALAPGYYRRATALLTDAHRVLIGTGFPVAGTFETDGPVGAMALYRVLEQRGAQCWIACATPLAAELEHEFRVLPLQATDRGAAREEATLRLAQVTPDAIVSIERPGLAADGRYYNMRGEDISADCGIFDSYLELAECPTIAIGDGGNEIGMGKVAAAVAGLAITPSATSCDELLVADVSNWGAYGLLAYLDLLEATDHLGALRPRELLGFLSARGSVDGVTRENTLTEDGLDPSAGEAIISELRALAAAAKREASA